MEQGLFTGRRESSPRSRVESASDVPDNFFPVSMVIAPRLAHRAVCDSGSELVGSIGTESANHFRPPCQQGQIAKGTTERKLGYHCTNKHKEVYSCTLFEPLS